MLKNTFFVFVIFNIAFTSAIFGWGKENHANITRAAINTLPKHEQRIFGNAADSLVETYSRIPDIYRYGQRNNIQSIIDEFDRHVNLPLLQSQKKFHKNEDSDSEISFYITAKLIQEAITQLEAKNPLEATKYLGSLAHYIEDNACPVHVLPDQTIFELMPSPDYPKRMDIHHAVEGPDFPIDISDYKPQLLGNNPVEASEAIYYRFKENRVNARAQIVPLLEAMYAKDVEKTNKYRAKAAEPAAKLYADILHTVCVLVKR